MPPCYDFSFTECLPVSGEQQAGLSKSLLDSVTGAALVTEKVPSGGFFVSDAGSLDPRYKF